MFDTMKGRPGSRRLPDCLFAAVTARRVRARLAVALDIGAHHGHVARSIVDELGFDHVYAFEPHPANFEKLLALNLAYPQISSIQSAVGLHHGSVIFTCNSDDATGSVLSYSQEAADATVRVRASLPMLALDAFARNFVDEGRDVGLVKIDTQGYDLAVLKGAEQTLRIHQPVVLLEFIYAALYVDQATPFDIEAWLRARDYRLASLVNIHVDGNGILAFADALFLPSSIELPMQPSYKQIDNEASWRSQLATFERICAERLVVIEKLDAEVSRLRALYESSC
jgi:FkbM family methyltransferase